tara:strand:- start:2770 stop:3522 length:753 start_codon:yes stop_codon:yes gene_type:complete
MAKKIALINEKGGVGKTTICFNLSKGLAAMGFKVLTIDNDPQANLTISMVDSEDSLQLTTLDVYNEDVDKRPVAIDDNLDFIGTNKNLSGVVDRQPMDVWHQLQIYIEDVESQYDYIFMDCCPTFGALNIAAMIASDYILTPVKPAPYSMDGLMKVTEDIKKMRKKRLNPDLKFAGIIFNLVENTTLHRKMMNVVKEMFGDLVFFQKIPRGTKLEESPFYNQSIFEYDQKSKVSILYKAVIKEFIRRIDA